MSMRRARGFRSVHTTLGYRFVHNGASAQPLNSVQDDELLAR